MTCRNHITSGGNKKWGGAVADRRGTLHKKRPELWMSEYWSRGVLETSTGRKP